MSSGNTRQEIGSKIWLLEQCKACGGPLGPPRAARELQGCRFRTPRRWLGDADLSLDKWPADDKYKEYLERICSSISCRPGEAWVWTLELSVERLLGPWAGKLGRITGYMSRLPEGYPHVSQSIGEWWWMCINMAFRNQFVQRFPHFLTCAQKKSHCLQLISWNNLNIWDKFENVVIFTFQLTIPFNGNLRGPSIRHSHISHCWLSPSFLYNPFFPVDK